MRSISYAQAINEALHQIIEEDERVFLIGQGVTSPWYVGSTTVGLIDRFGPERIIDTPVSENGITGVASGALGGRRFLDAVDAIAQAVPHTNEAAKRARRDGEAHQHHFGMASYFLTVTPDDDNSFLVQV